MASNYDCPTCQGSGETECDCCGAERACETCGGSGYDGKRLDLDRLNKDHEAAAMRWNGSASLIRDGKEVGRQSINRATARGPEYADEVLYLADYAKEAPNE